MSSDTAAKLWDDNINRRIFDLMHSTTTAENFGGLLAIDNLLEVDGEETIESRRNLFRFYNYVKHLLPNPDVNLMLAASKTLGQIAEIGGSAFGERFMDFEVPAAIELMHPDKQESPRYAGVLILKELARNSPTYFHSHINIVFENILVPLRDQRVIVREGAAELLAACLEIVTLRERQTRSPYLVKILTDAQSGLKHSQPEVIHGSLLTYRELLLHAGMFMKENFMDTAEQILHFKLHRDGLVRKMVITMIPSLAAYDTQTFTEHFLHKAMAHLLTQLERPNERYYAFIAIGHTATAVGSDMKPFLEPIMVQIKAGLQGRGRRGAVSEEPIFQCVGMLASAVGPNLTKLLHDQLDLMFQAGLSEPLRQALAAIARHIPPLLKTIQERLLDLLCRNLSGQPYKPLGAPPSLDRNEPLPLSRDLNVSQVTTAHEKNPELLTLALTTLGSFDFSGHTLNEVVRSCALPYLEDDHAEVRRAAALTCCRLFVRDPICYQASSHAIEVISDVLDKLLTVGIADPDPSIRQTVLSSLHERFDKHLAQAENVRSLFIALNDEVYENRVTAVNLIGRLAKHNPAYVMPSLRKALIQLLTELEYSTVRRSREECTRLLTLLVSATQRIIKPYALPMLRALLEKANDPNPVVAAHILMCMGELTCAGGESAMIYIPQLMNVIMVKLSDTSLVKRDAALHTLGQLCSSTGYVISPVVEYPQLLQVLWKILKTEPTQAVRREVIKVLGILGAVDPYRRKNANNIEDATSETAVMAVNQVPINQPGPPSASDDYFQTVVITSLLAVLKDPALSSHHHAVIEAIMSIFKTQGLKSVAFLPQIIPAFASVTKSSSARYQEFHLQQLAILVGILKQHIRNYAKELISLINGLWDNATLQLPIVSLIEALGKALNAEFKPHLSGIIPLILKVFEGDPSEKKMTTQIKVLDALQTFGANIEEYLHLVIPVIVKSYERIDGSMALRKKAIQTIDGLSKRVNFSDHASRIVHPLVRVLDNSNNSNELRTAVLDTMCSLAVQLGSDFAIFVPTINKALLRNRFQHSKYETLISKLLNGEKLPQDVDMSVNETSRSTEYSAPAEAAKMTVNQQHLKQAWDTSQVTTKDDWTAWMHRLSVEFMKESPSHALRACMSLVDIHPPLAKELFNAAFLSCWVELYDQYQEDLVRSIETAISSSTAPSELIHRWLNLAEFMEHEEKPLPIEHRILGEYALKYLAYAKALHYKELEYFSDVSPSTIEALITINTRLQQHDAAWGTLIMAREQYDVTRHEEWYERLGRWQEALQVYDRKAEVDPNAPGVQIGRMKCLNALGEWDQLAAQVDEIWDHANREDRREIGPIAAAAAWSLNEWDSMDDYIATMRPDSPDRAFYRAILSIHQNQFTKALTQIARARDLLDPELTSFVGEGYVSSYNIMVRAQMLSELEEIIAYKQSADQPDKQATMRKTWMKRLQGCQRDVEVWQRILQVRTLVLKPEEAPQMWIKFANLCRKSERMVLAEKTIESLLSTSPTNDQGHHIRVQQSQRAPPDVVYAHLKYIWVNGAREESLQYLRQFSAQVARDLQLENEHQRSGASKQRNEHLSRLLARCYFKLGEWQKQLSPDWGSIVQDILNCYVRATRYDPEWYKAWHTWALANVDYVSLLESQSTDQGTHAPHPIVFNHAVQAIEGLFQSISLRNQDALQDMLRLLTLWFKFGSNENVSNAMAQGFAKVGLDTWLHVIPQVNHCRVQTPNLLIRRTIHTVLINIGKHHPQALIYPLTALVVSNEIIRIAILWHEQWHEGLEEASRLYFTEKNPEGMIAVLEPLHAKLEETSFAQVFGRELAEAREACRRYRNRGETSELDKAWDIYYAVFKKIEKQLPQLTTLDLQYVSPILLSIRNLTLAVPGTYQSGREVITISSFAQKLTVIASKQRPRRFSLRGSDGRDYQYILKGHEDLRQDERVMQLFSLVNNLLSVDTQSYIRRLHIQRYPVIPLAPNAGLIGLVQGSDTLHVLVRDYRDSRKVLLNIEYRLMLQMAPDYENLTLLQKVEVFEYALENTTGQDLYRVLWLKSKNSEHWLERRTTYTRSLAVNSMVGHILGLGDRHPSNILVERSTGKVINIDFGDCFEVAMMREKFPETVPFRLTRMLTHAMEVSGIEGSFRNTCEITMGVMRDNKESLMAVLEPSWRLMQTDESRRPEADNTAELARAAGYPQGPARRKFRADENDIFGDVQVMGDPTAGGDGMVREVRNDRALAVYERVQKKLTGRDFGNEPLTVKAQVDKLIIEATSLENLSLLFSGW
ncbi:FAT-domain-containing protein [Dendrothele bispora CBS 962.96]|uniref:Serine/threonine-protein kinase TOR n=2 Tax=Dendrothele bispora (strain CBS 962.96) TaxID=1314807 RepID=A0A4S8MRS4_DENBC|nr:FAT-domain-containing protein [Dendrothele bispora CBS 962.96]